MSVEDYIYDLKDVIHRYNIHSRQFVDRDLIEGDEIDSLCGLVQAIEATNADPASNKEKRSLKSTIKPLEDEVRQIQKLANGEIDSINDYFSQWFGEQERSLHNGTHEDWQNALQMVETYRRFSDKLLALTGLQIRQNKNANQLQDVIIRKARLDEELDLIASRYGSKAFANKDEAEETIGELSDLRGGYESIGFRRKLFPIPKRAEVYSFDSQYSQIDELSGDAQYIRDNFEYVSSARRELERDIKTMQRMKTKALPLQEVEPHQYDGVEPLIHTRELVGQYKDLCFEINGLLNQQLAKQKRYLRPQVVIERPVVVNVIERKVSDDYVPQPIVQAAEKVQTDYNPIQDDIFMPAPKQPRFNLFAYLQFNGPPPSETTWKVEQILAGKTDAKPWDDRMRALGQTIQNAGSPKPEEVEYLGAIREGLKESLRSGPLQELCSRLVFARSPIRMAMETLESYLSPGVQNQLSFTTA